MSTQRDLAQAEGAEMSWEQEQIGACTVYREDALELLAVLPPVDAIVTDPPYGIGASSGVGKYGIQKWGKAKDLQWDSHAPDALVFALLATKSTHQIIWGMNYFPLPVTRHFLVWDKGAGFKARTFAECELAWCSFDGNAKVFTRDPLAARDYEGKQHPTQKPVPLMRWCIEQLPPSVFTILDCYAGSGTTGVAAVLLGKTFIGIERERQYFDVMCQRLTDAYKQPSLFPAPAPKPQQLTLTVTP